METGILVSDEEMKESALMSKDQNFDSFNSTTRIQPNNSQINLFGPAYEFKPELGLKLSQTPSFLNKIDQLAQKQNYNVGNQQPSLSSYGYVMSNQPNSTVVLQQQQEAANKWKAENFPMSLLCIGSWKRESRNEGDLVAKCYFAKKKLVWEYLEKGLKSKIEIMWADILSLRAVLQEDQHGILDIELNRAPKFYHEIDPQPRKHTQWKMVQDFTGGQALAIRRHHLKFPPGALNRTYEKLLICDVRLFQLSQQGFPTFESPYFPTNTYGSDTFFNFGGQEYMIPPQQQLSFSNAFPAANYVPEQHFQTYIDQHRAQPSLINFNNSDSPISDELNTNQMRQYGQGMLNNVPECSITNQDGRISLAPTSIHQVHPPMASSFQEPDQRMSLAPTSIPQVPPPMASSFQEPNQRVQPNYLQDIVQTADFSNGIADQGNLTTTNYGLLQNVTNYGYGVQNNVAAMNNNYSSYYVDRPMPIFPQISSYSDQPQTQIPYDTNLLLPNNNSFYNSPADSDSPNGYFPNSDFANFDSATGCFPNFNQNEWT